ETLGEPTIDRGEKIVSLLSFALIVPQPRHAHSRTQFPRLCLLLTSDRQRMFEIFFRFRCVWVGRRYLDFACHALDLGLKPTFLGCFYLGHRFANAVPCIIEVVEFSMSARQIRQAEWH